MKPPSRSAIILAVGALLLGLSVGTLPPEDRSFAEFIKHLLPAIAGLICVHQGVKALLRNSN